jgi:alkaline phosphatase D
MAVDFQVLPYVTRPGAPAHTRASFVIEDRVPGLHQVADSPTPGGTSALRTGDLGEATVRQETERP